MIRVGNSCVKVTMEGRGAEAGVWEVGSERLSKVFPEEVTSEQHFEG